MNIICVDDERILLNEAVSICRELPEAGEVTGFVWAREALDYAERRPVDLALLDINMPDMNGIQLAAKIKERQPDTAIIFLTGYSEYAVEAFAVRASGYLLKPVTREALLAEISYALSEKQKRFSGRIFVQTFGNFDIFVEGKPVFFKMAKCKEILAYLVDRRGSGVTRGEIFSAVWEDRTYDRGMQKQLDVYLRSLRATLRECGAEQMVEGQKGVFRVRPEAFTCDAYLFFSGDTHAINAYRGEYMSAYPWASMTESMMYWQLPGRGGNR